jgi:HlyD family secretion protein
LAELQAGPRPQEVAAATAAVDKAKSHLAGVKVTGPPLEITAAEAEVRANQAQLDLVKAGARVETISAAKAEVAAAQATLDQAKVTLANTELRAPFSGTVVGLKMDKGEFVSPGTPVVRVADTSVWQVETEDLTEINVVKVREGAKASVTFDALPDLNIIGKVVDINPLGESKSGDITYTVTIDPERQDSRLRWNMTATVTIKQN